MRQKEQNNKEMERLNKELKEKLRLFEETQKHIKEHGWDSRDYPKKDWLDVN
jgi:hypothetical protein